MFRLLRVIIRPSIEQTQDYLIHSALWDTVALTPPIASATGSQSALRIRQSCVCSLEGLMMTRRSRNM